MRVADELRAKAQRLRERADGLETPTIELRDLRASLKRRLNADRKRLEAPAPRPLPTQPENMR